MSFLDAFITVKKNDDDQPPQLTPGKQVAAQVPIQKPVEAPPQTILLNGGVVDQKYVTHFEKVMDNANLPGPDYYEFRKAFDDTEEFKTSMTEDTRLKMVFKTMSSNGLTKQIILDSAAQYKDVLLNDKTNFESELSSKRDTDIGGRQTLIEQLTATNQDKEKQIAQLQADMQQNNEKIIAAKGEIATMGNQLDTTLTNFTVTYNAFIGQIDNDIAKINQSL